MLKEGSTCLVAIPLLLAGCLTLGCLSLGLPEDEPPPPSYALGQADPQLRAEVVEELQQYYEDLSARDWAAFAAHFWPGATIQTVWVPPGEERAEVMVSSVEEFVAKAPEGPGSQPIFEERMLGHEVRIYGDLASVWATYEAKFGDENHLEHWGGIDAFTLLRLNGRWKIVSLGFSSE